MSGIEWCDRTWPLVYGCSQVSDGCKNCYAEQRWVPRFQANPRSVLHDAGIVTADSRWTGKVVMLEQNLDWPYRGSKSKPERIFVNPFSDLFHEAVPAEFIHKVFRVMAMCYGCTFMILTKRPQMMKVRIEQEYKHGQYPERFTLPLPNVWLGVSVEDQKAADQRIPHLLNTPAGVRFISVEPMLGPVELGKWLHVESNGGIPGLPAYTEQIAGPSLIDWVICGGETGKGARPMHPDWARSLRDQCKAADVAFFFKQWGEYLHESQIEVFGLDWLKSSKRDPSGEFCRVGKKAAGRLLDGVEYSEFPVVS